MTIEELALVAFTAFFAVSFAILLKRDTYVAGVYFFLFIYTIFAQIGYYYYPELSNQIEAYFGQDIFLSYTFFVSLSFLMFFIFVRLALSLTHGISYQVVWKKRSLYGLSFWIIVSIHLAWTFSYFVLNYDLLNYSTASNDAFLAEQGIPLLLFGISFKLSVVVIIVLYALMRLNGEIPLSIGRGLVPFFLVLEAVLFAAIATKIANRTDVVAIALGICMLEYKLGGGFKKLAKLAVFTAVVLYGLILIEGSRFSGPVENQFLSELILLKDYFAPAHILFAAMHYDFLDPLEVLVSNTLNSLVLFGHPYLQATITDMFNPGIATRSAGYAFYIFTEGYLALGPPGFLYNGVVVGSGVLLWRGLAASENRAYNLFMLALISTQMANIVRSQSSYFIKDIYVFFLPAMVLFFLASGIRPALRPLKKSSAS